MRRPRVVRSEGDPQAAASAKLHIERRIGIRHAKAVGHEWPYHLVLRDALNRQPVAASAPFRDRVVRSSDERTNLPNLHPLQPMAQEL